MSNQAIEAEKGKMKSYLDLLDECDSFPYPTDEKSYKAFQSTLYTLIWPTSPTTSTPIGYVLEPILSSLLSVPSSIRGPITINHELRTISAFVLPSPSERSAQIAAVLQYWRENQTFAVLKGWRDELYPIYLTPTEKLFDIERSASCLFGFVTYGVHMTGYTKSSEAEFGIKIWVPRRVKTKQTFGGMLDNTVAGGMASGEEPLECVVREAGEEASLDEEFVRRNIRYEGKITYCYIREERCGGEEGLVMPEVQYVYDLEIPVGMEPKPRDGEVEEFYLWGIKEVKEALGKGEFKPNCALLMLDFFVRWGIVEREEDREEIRRRLSRRLEFPGPWEVKDGGESGDVEMGGQ